MIAAAAFPVTDASQVGAPQRAAARLAAQLHFSEEGAGRVALVATELATNLVKHARGGEILLQPLCGPDGGADAVEIVAVDAGPGLGDAARSRADGFSTTGTLGHGLGAVGRQSDAFDLYTTGAGTIAVARVCRDEPGRRWRQEAPVQVGAVRVARPGEDVCGDDWGWRMREGRLAIMVADGLGHGLHAHDAAVEALRVFGRTHEQDPARVIGDAHAALRATRGAAVAMLAVDLDRGVARYAGLGNIAGTIAAPGGPRHHLVSHNGTAGHAAARVQEFHYPVPRGSILVLASDGLGTQWDLAAYPGLHAHPPTTIAALLYRDFSRRRDDVTVVVAKERPADAEKL